MDIGLRNYLLGFRDMDTGHIIENIVYFELLRRGYDVAIGKVDERELAPLRKIRDNYEKLVITNECQNPITQDGIKIVKLTDFFLDESK